MYEAWVLKENYAWIEGDAVAVCIGTQKFSSPNQNYSHKRKSGNIHIVLPLIKIAVRCRSREFDILKNKYIKVGIR